MDKIQRTVINKLLDQYESSKTFQGENKVQQSFAVDICKCFPRYKDDAEYDFFLEVNEALTELQEKKLISIKKRKNGTFHLAVLNTEKLEDCYQFLSRVPKKEENEWLLQTLLWMEFEYGELLPIKNYIDDQKEILGKNKNVKFYDGDKKNYIDTMKMIAAVLRNEEELFIRDFSINLFQDSKRAEQLKEKVSSFLIYYGDFEEKDSVLEECGVVDTPTYVTMKGNVLISLGGQLLDLSKLNGDVSLSTMSLKEIDFIRVLGTRVVTVENLTSFHKYKEKSDCVIYLGGFHNKTKRKFLCYLYEQNKEKEYRHFGDIDAGGFYILEHLKRKTNIHFRSLYMDSDTLLAYSKEVKKLTKSDKIRILRLRDDLIQRKKEEKLDENYLPVLDLMLEKEWKLEQEAVQK